MQKTELDAIVEDAKNIAERTADDTVKLMGYSIQLQAETLMQVSSIKRTGIAAVADRLNALGSMLAEVMKHIEGRLAVIQYDIIEDEDEAEEEEEEVEDEATELSGDGGADES